MKLNLAERRRLKRAQSERLRYLTLGVASLLAHLILLLLIPGLLASAQQETHQIRIELTMGTGTGGTSLGDQAPGPPFPGPPVAGPTPDPAHAPVAKPTMPGPESPRHAQPATKPLPTVKPAVKPVAPVRDRPPTPVKPAEATEVKDPVVAPPSNQSVPAAPPKAAPQPEAQPQVNLPSGPPPAGPPAPPSSPPGNGGGDGSGGGGGGTPQGSGQGGSGGGQGDAPGSGGGGGDGSGTPGAGQGGDGPGEVVGPPAPPPGPSQHELDLLQDYGDAALKRIKSQARNPENKAEGTVVFEFDVARNGRLIDVRILQSSGRNLLDNDVLESTRAAFNDAYEIIPFSKDIQLDQWTFKRSIKYPLY